MKYVEPTIFSDPDVAARRLVEIASTVEPARDDRIYIELINPAMPRCGRCAGAAARGRSSDF